MNDIKKHHDDLTAALWAAIWDYSQTHSWPIAGDDNPAAEWLANHLLGSLALAQIVADAKAEAASGWASLIESEIRLHEMVRDGDAVIEVSRLRAAVAEVQGVTA